MKSIEFEIPGKPKALARPRKGNNGFYCPDAKAKQDFLLQAKQYAPKEPFTGEIYLNCTFSFSRPVEHYRTGRYAGQVKKRYEDIMHTSRPDLDNCVKFVMDALNGVFFKDDSQIAILVAEKRYDDEPYSYVSVEEL